MSKSTTSNKKYAGWNYICDRMRYQNSIGDYRCDEKVEGNQKCEKQCEKCLNYYSEKIIEK